MADQFERTRRLLGEEGMARLRAARVAVFGLGGVGGYVCEALVRSGVGHLDLIDHDRVAVSNLNRQIIATGDTVGRPKTEVMRERLLSVCPQADIRLHECFFLPENADSFPFEEYDYIADAVDTVTAKIELVKQAQRHGIPVISSMGTGNKLDPSRLKVSDLSETSVCPLARIMRRELKRRGMETIRVVWSDEPPLVPEPPEEETAAAVRRDTPGSAVFVPAAAGLLMASVIVRDLIRAEKWNGNTEKLQKVRSLYRWK